MFYCYSLRLQGGAGVWFGLGDKEAFLRGWTFFSCLSESFRLKGGGWPVFTCCYTGWRRPLSQPLSPAQTATQHCWASGHRAGRCTCSCTSLPSTFFAHTSVLAVSCNAGTQRVSSRVDSIHLYIVKASFCCSIFKHNLKAYISLLCR